MFLYNIHKLGTIWVKITREKIVISPVLLWLYWLLFWNSVTGCHLYEHPELDASRGGGGLWTVCCSGLSRSCGHRRRLESFPRAPLTSARVSGWVRSFIIYFIYLFFSWGFGCAALSGGTLLNLCAATARGDSTPREPAPLLSTRELSSGGIHPAGGAAASCATPPGG